MRFSKSTLLFHFLIIFLYFSFLNAQQNVFTITPSLNDVSLGKYIEILEDETGTLTINDITSAKQTDKFLPSEEEEPGFGFTSSVYWVKLTVNNPRDQLVNWYLEIGYPLLDYIDLYIPDDVGGFITKRTGDRLSFNSREINHRNFVFNLTEEPNNVRTYYLRFQTSSSMNFPLQFWQRDTFFEKTSMTTALLGIFYGAVIIMIIYNIFLFIGFLDKSYVYNVLFITSWGLTQSALNGLAFQYIWPNWIWWANVNIPFFIFAAVLSANQFARSLLITSKNAPLWDKIIKIENILFISGMGLSLMTPYAVTIRFAAASAIITVIVLLLTTISCMRKKIRSSYYFIAAWGFYFLGVVLFALKSFGVLSSNFITNWSMQIGAFALLVLFSIAVQDRINRERKEKYKAQQDLLKNQQKLVKSLQKSERILEKKVKERTKELFNKNVSLKKSTEELQESANELDTLDNIVKTINREIEFGNVVNALLEQGLKLFPQAQHGAALIYNTDTECYHFLAAVGDDLKVLKNKSMTIDEIRATFSHMSEEVIKGIYIIRKSKESGGSVVFELTQSKSIMAMSISLEDQLAGFLLFDNTSSSDAFDQSDARKCGRFRSHAISAFVKSKLLLDVKKINNEIVKTQDQLIVQEKMASLGQLTAGIAHEIKNPLNFVNNFAEGSVELSDELIEEIERYKNKLETNEYQNIIELLSDIRQNVTDIHDNGKRADRIVRSMMDHARGTKTEFEKEDINDLITENINLAYHGYRAREASFNVDIIKQFDDSLPEVQVKSQDFGRAILNILNNACYAVHRKAKEKGEDYSPTITISTKSMNGEVEIRVRDNGPGISPKIRDQIFNPFFTTKPTGEGNTGLGLSISYDIIVQEHHGKLEVESEPGEFSKFIITLPKSGDKK
jgi:signal transduction histidine kinase